MEDIEVVRSQHEKRSSHVGIDAQEGSAFDPVLRSHRGANNEDIRLRTYLSHVSQPSLLQVLPISFIALLSAKRVMAHLVIA